MVREGGRDGRLGTTGWHDEAHMHRLRARLRNTIAGVDLPNLLCAQHPAGETATQFFAVRSAGIIRKCRVQIGSRFGEKMMNREEWIEYLAFVAIVIMLTVAIGGFLTWVFR